MTDDEECGWCHIKKKYLIIFLFTFKSLDIKL